ncbi:MAG: CDP-glucose 4,6-dehydratase [Bacteroidia bacterium]|nr:CDP-glucose 4,6-dehydratase [Bacteroidia bacterium]
MFGNVFNNKKVLVTGNTGFKGTWLTQWLRQLGAEVVGISISVPTNPSMFETLNLRNDIEHYDLDINELERLKEIFVAHKPDFVFHLAAQPIVRQSYIDPVETFRTNTLGTAHVMEALRALENECIATMITSDKCYENVEWNWGYRETDRLGGKDPYSASKGAAELVIHSYIHSFFNTTNTNIKIASVRAGNVIGGGDWAASRIVPDTVKSWANEEPVEIRSPRATRPWQHVLEPLSGYLRCAQVLATDGSNNGEAYNFGPDANQNKSVLELLTKLSDHWPFKSDSEKVVVQEQSNFHEAGLLKLSCDKALADLSWQPTLEFDQTIEFTASWYYKYYNEQDSDIIEYTNQQIAEYCEQARLKNASWMA